VVVHISDLADYYVLILKKILQGEKLPSGEEGYYFAVAHEVSWWDIAQGLADALHARGLVKDPTAKIWPSDDMAAEALDLPRQYVRLMHTAR
jgi:dTDP-4-dehydrorhamnose reductase